MGQTLAEYKDSRRSTEEQTPLYKKLIILCKRQARPGSASSGKTDRKPAVPIKTRREHRSNAAYLSVLRMPIHRYVARMCSARRDTRDAAVQPSSPVPMECDRQRADVLFRVARPTMERISIHLRRVERLRKDSENSDSVQFSPAQRSCAFD